jgi:hypothetical protein
MSDAAPRPGLRTPTGLKVARVVMALILVGVIAALLYKGWSFYQLDLDDRVEHPDYKNLRPGGFWGHGLGFVGAFLILLNLLYLARRKHLFTFGSMRTWLDVHVFTGLLGAALVAFHSAFQLRASIARISAISLAVVVVTGIIGRFLHILVGSAQKKSLPDAILALEAKVPGLGKVVGAAADELPPTILPADASHLRCLGTIPRWRKEARDRADAVRIAAANHKQVISAVGAEARELQGLIYRASRAAAADVRAIMRLALLRSWKSLHRLFAILMIVAVAVHVGVAWHFGYRWIFSSE